MKSKAVLEEATTVDRREYTLLWEDCIKFPVNVLQAANTYIKNGIAITPCDYRAKDVAYGAFPEDPVARNLYRGRENVVKVCSEEAPLYFFGNGFNIAICNGECSNGLVDIDLDRPEAVAVAQYILPPTRKSGREGKELAHFWYLIKGQIPNTRWFQLPPGKAGERRMIVELRSTGTQTLAPPSIYPEGERCVWGGDEVFRISGDKLVEYVDDVAAAALLRLHCPDDVGARRKFAMSAASYLSSRLVPRRVRHIVIAMIRASADQQWLSTPFLDKDLEATVEKIVTGKRVKGVVALEKVAPDVAITLLRFFQWNEQRTRMLPKRLLQSKNNGLGNERPRPVHTVSSLEIVRWYKRG